MSTPLDPASTLADLAVTYPQASRVFRRHGLDYCCHGRRPVSAACEERGLDPGALLGEIAAESRDGAAGARWAERPLPAVVDRIVAYYHARLRGELPLLVQMARKVEAVHAEKASVPRGLATHLDELTRELLDHMEKEEQGLFPAIAPGPGGGPLARVAPIVTALEREHEDVALALRRTRELTADLVPPAEACTTWRALYLRLDELEAELMEHVHLENNVLFPRALCAEA